jgi:hypothetical protein
MHQKMGLADVIFRNYIKPTADAWKVELKNKSFSLRLFLMPGLFFIYSAVTQHLSNYVEMRPGIQLEDKLLSVFPAFDFSTYVFLLLYTSLIAVIVSHLNQPKIILRVIEMHFLVAVVRQVCILLVALEPPAGIIVLRDLFLENTVYPHNIPLTKDLFFSGHVASIWIYFLCARSKYLKAYFAIATLFMGFMILSMRVHYTYDVYGAIIFTSLIYFAPAWVRSYYVKERAGIPA